MPRKRNFFGHEKVSSIGQKRGMAATNAQTLRPHVRSFGGELAVHGAGLRALASSLVADPRVRWGRMRCYATDDVWCIFEVVQAVAIDPKSFIFVKVSCCVFSRHVSAELNTQLAGHAQHYGQKAQRSPADPTTATRGVVAKTRHRRCGGNQCLCLRPLTRRPSKSRGGC